MNVLVIGRFYVEGFALHISQTLRSMGHDVRIWEPGSKMGRLQGRVGRRLDQIRGALHTVTDGVPAVRSFRARSLWEVVDGSVDAVLVCHDFLWPAEVAELKRRTGAPVAMWFPDHLANFGRGYFMTAPYDALFFKDPYIVQRLGGVTPAPVYYLPECFNPMSHRIAENPATSQYECDITTAGNLHSYRVALLAHLDRYRVRLWGGPPPLWLQLGRVQEMYQGRPIWNEEKAAAFVNAKIVLNNMQIAEIWGLNARAFEAAGIGAFQLIDWRPGLSQLFDDGRELVTFKGLPDLLKKVDYWLPREEQRRAIAERGKKRAHAEHTYTLRLNLLLETLGGNARGFGMPALGF